MTSDPAATIPTLAEVIDRELRARGTRERAEKERAYLKSAIDHYGVSVPDTRSIVRAALRESDLGHDEAIDLARELWAVPVHERCTAATMVLIRTQDHLGAGDADVIEGFLRESRTWALVDPLAGDLVGPLSERDSRFDPVFERWAFDEDFWIRHLAAVGASFVASRGRDQ